MNRRRIKKIVIVVLAGCLLTLVALYSISGRSCRAVFFIAQGWACHYISNAILLAGWYSGAIECQRLSVKGYEESDRNVSAAALHALICDELRVMANIYISHHKYPEALETVSKVERLVRDEIATGPTDEDKWRRVLGELLLCHARLLYGQGRFKDAAGLYKEAIVNGENLINDKLSDSTTAAQIASARQELVETVAQMVPR
ncbi:MAG: hypothetical protein JST01_15830 [Cyanobacteria bacterium SZAS TMP-1]|nr:hypothetical protein [Cyanobacteria bacterium SZAS TMP-1]